MKWVNGHTPFAAQRRRELAHRRGVPTRGVERHERLPGAAVPDELDRPEHAQSAHLPDRRMPRRHLAQLRADHGVAELARVFVDPFVLEDPDRRDRRRARERMAGIGEAARIGRARERSGDRSRDDHAAERHVTGVDALGERDEVGGDAPPVDREPLAAPAEAGHHLVGDHHDAVLVADRAHAREVTVGRDEDAVGADDRLEDDRRDVVRPFEHQDFAQVRERTLALLGLGRGMERRAIEIRAPVVHDSGDAGLAEPTARAHR